MPPVAGPLTVPERSTPVSHRPAPGWSLASAPPPRLLGWVCAAVVAAGVVMAVVGALRTGISWDEPFHVMRLRNYLDHGWFALDWSVDSGGTTEGGTNTLVYGPLTMLLLHGLGVLVGVEGWHSVATTPEAYAVRHLGVVAIGLVGTAAAAATTRLLLGSWRWGLVTAAALMALPMWTGHLMFNIKDVPVATGYALLTLALVAMVPPTRGRSALRVLALFAGTVLMVGTRPAMASAVLGSVLLVLVGTALVRGRVGRLAGEIAVGLGAASVLLVALYPGVYADPLSLLRSAEQSTSFRGGGGSGPLYVPFHLATQFPLLLQGAAVLGLVHVVRTAVRRRRSDGPHVLRLVLVVSQVAALPLVGVLRDADLYNGLRQLLFAVPAWGVLATLGLAQVLVWARAYGRVRLAGALAVVALVAPTADQATLFPYQYSYWNAGLDLTGAAVMSDYWRTSVPELLPDIPTDGQVVCGPTRSSRLGALAGSAGADGVEGAQLQAGRYSSDSSVDCRTDPLGPLSSRWAADGLPLDDDLPHDEFYVVIDRDHDVPQNCARLASVDRRRHLFREASMTYVARCHLDPPPLTGPVWFLRWPGANLAPQQWAFAPQGWVARRSAAALDAEGPRASLTFTLPPGCATCSLQLDADAPADLRATVDDEPATVRVGDGSVVVDLAPGVSADAAGTWVTFTRSSGAPLGLRVRSIRAVPTGTG